MDNHTDRHFILFFPLGLVQRRFKRGIIITGLIWTMFMIVASSGHYYQVLISKTECFYLLNVFARFGNGLGALISYWAASTPDFSSRRTCDI
jgi:hypothetical protein